MYGQKLKDLAKQYPDYTFSMAYNVWAYPHSREHRQEWVRNISASDLAKKYGEFTLENWYSTGRDTADIWAIPEGKEFIYDSPSPYSEIRIDYFNEEENKWFVDAWKTTDTGEEGITVAKIDGDTFSIEYLEEYADTDELVQENIKDFLEYATEKEVDF